MTTFAIKKSSVTVDVSAGLENYEAVSKQTMQRWVRNDLTGKLYEEAAGIRGALVRFHVLGLYLSAAEYATLLGWFESREAVAIKIDGGSDISVVFVDDEFRMNQETPDLFQGTIVLEEVSTK